MVFSRMRFPDLYRYYTQLSPLSEDGWRILEEGCRPVSFERGSTIFSIGERCEEVFAIRRGVARTYYRTHAGKEYINIFLVDGQIVSPYNEMINNIPAHASAEALTDIEGVAVPFAKLMESLDLSDEVRKLHLQLIHYFYMVKERREFELLTMDATQRYEAYLSQYANYDDQMELPRFSGEVFYAASATVAPA